MQITALLALGGIVLLALLLLSRKGNRLRISKEDAETIVMRRFRDGRVVGTRFTNDGPRFVWEFDVFESGFIHRVRIDANTAVIVNERYLPAHQSYGPPLGMRKGR